MNSLYDESPFLEHHGIKGQKWGVRRFQNYDGTRIKGSDIVLKKGEKVYRYSNKKETSGDTREKQLQEYVKNGYDAIVDPEDFIWNYEMPMILLNNDKFKRVRSEAVYNNDFDTYSKWADEQLAKGVPRRDVEFTPEETKALNNFINGANRKLKKKEAKK